MTETAPSILSPSYPTEEVYQRVPGSPLSPFYTRPSTQNLNYNASPVPEVFSGSPLLRQILRGNLRGKRTRLSSTDCSSPNITKRKRACLSPLVPSPAIYSATPEQVVPALSPQDVASAPKLEDYRRKLPEEKEGVKPLDLFNGDDIFAPSHEE